VSPNRLKSPVVVDAVVVTAAAAVVVAAAAVADSYTMNWLLHL